MKLLLEFLSVAIIITMLYFLGSKAIEYISNATGSYDSSRLIDRNY